MQNGRTLSMSNTAPSITQRTTTTRAESVQPPEPPDRSVPSLISAQAAIHPQNLALVREHERVTYAELESRANQLANYLKARGIGREDLIAICLERSPEFVITALAILKCGAAYLPMDLVHPAERLRYMISDGGVRLLLTETKFVDRWEGVPVEIIALDAERETIQSQSSNAPLAQSSTNDLAYVIYTSGSTGKPKGVEIAHESLSNLVSWHVETFRLDSSSRTTFQASVGFDAAVWEIWPTLTAGAALYFPDEQTRLAPEKLRDWLVQQQITVSFVPTVVAEELIALPWPNETALRFLLTGADTLHRYPSPGLPFVLVNNYGPTECTVVATSGIVPAGENNGRTPSIGLPIFQVRVHILDENGCEVPDGLTGEIYVGGAGLARGYRNRKDLTEERFVTGLCVDDPSRLYRTGDLACRLPNGEIAFVGRIDDQMKIRGYRIEPAEINAVLKDHPLVKASAVIAREDRPGEKKTGGLCRARGRIRKERATTAGSNSAGVTRLHGAGGICLGRFNSTNNQWKIEPGSVTGSANGSVSKRVGICRSAHSGGRNACWNYCKGPETRAHRASR